MPRTAYAITKGERIEVWFGSFPLLFGDSMSHFPCVGILYGAFWFVFSLWCLLKLLDLRCSSLLFESFEHCLITIEKKKCLIKFYRRNEWLWQVGFEWYICVYMRKSSLIFAQHSSTAHIRNIKYNAKSSVKNFLWKRLKTNFSKIFYYKEGYCNYYYLWDILSWQYYECFSL